MIKSISIKNFKSVEEVTLPLGRVTVLIGENGSGKSNILEAITFLGAAAADKLDREFITSRGIRYTDSVLMASAFPVSLGNSHERQIQLNVISQEGFNLRCELELRESRWIDVTDDLEVNSKLIEGNLSLVEERIEGLTQELVESLFLENAIGGKIDDVFASILKTALPVGSHKEPRNKFVQAFRPVMTAAIVRAVRAKVYKAMNLSRFVIYTPENTSMRRFEEENQLQPVGIRGEGLFKMLETFAREENAPLLEQLKRSLSLIGWFVDFHIPPNLSPGEYRLRIHDRYLGPEVPLDQRSANEGFLFLLFYFAVMLHPESPPVFAIDNIDASLNPKLCAELMRSLCELAQKMDKQIIVTTHNPALLDGLNLHDREQRLYSVFRNEEGRTRVRQIPPPKPPPPDRTPLKLSEAFLRGLIGALPKNF